MSATPYPLLTDRTATDSASRLVRSANTASAVKLVALDSRLDGVERDTRRLDRAEPDTSKAPHEIVTIDTSRVARQHRTRVALMLALADTLALTLAFASAKAGFQHSPWGLGWVTFTGLLVLCVGAKSSGLHDRDQRLSRGTTLDEIPALFQLSTLCVLASWITVELLDGRTPYAVEVVELWLALTLLLITGRIAARRLDTRLSFPERCLLIGDERLERELCSKLRNRSGMGATVVARIGIDDLQANALDNNFMGAVSEIRYLAQSLEVQRAILPPQGDAKRLHDLVGVLQTSGLKVSVLPARHDVLGPSIEFEDIDGMTIMSLRHFESSTSSALVKRTFDLVLTLAILLVTLPLMLLIALAIKLDSRGPVFFRQLRVGKRGSSFRIFKFRTMVRDAESLKSALAHRNDASTGLFKINDDPRVTRVGRFLRKTSLDELPQLFNVLGGDMSLVGPRPLIPEEDSRIERCQRRRLELLPGITGPWQILGPVRVSLDEMAGIDNRYLLNRSTWTDVTILIRTVAHIFAQRGL